MCGIAGLIRTGLSEVSGKELMERMLGIQKHRGPDATGVWIGQGVALGHNRLSIIDLSEAANQPMWFDDYAIVFNGEVYNYLEIKIELERLGHRFVTYSDTEVILHAFKEWGEGCVNRFVGMWAFGIWNTTTLRFFASRDRFGIKPFHYIFKGGELHFASEVKTLKASPLFSNELNLAQVSRGLQMGWMTYEDETYFQCVNNLPAAHNLILDEQGLRVERYWDISGFEKSDLGYDAKVERFRELFLESIRLHLRSDVPVASCLSGGIDSSAIVSAVNHQGHEGVYKTFSIYYPGEGDVDERPFVNEVVSKFKNLDPYYYSPSDLEVAEVFDRALYHCDFPATGSSFISQYFLMRLISQNGIKVVLDGQGADEYLGGYMHTYYRLIGSMIGRFKWGRAWDVTGLVGDNLGLGAVSKFAHLGKSLLNSMLTEQRVYQLEYNHYHPFLVKEMSGKTPFSLGSQGDSRMDRFLYNLMFSTSLPSLLHYEDRNSMAFSIESRVPFLDHRLVEYAFCLDDSDRVNGLSTKRILRESMKGIIPDAIYQRRDKKGFVTPGESKWLRGPLSHLLNDTSRIPSFLNEKKVKDLLEKYRSGDQSVATMVWRIVVLLHWTKNN